MESSLVLGVDAGSAHVVAVLAELAEGDPQVIGVGVIPCTGVRKGHVVDLQSTALAVGQAAAKACEMAGRPLVDRAVISISGPHIQSAFGSAEIQVHRPSQGVSPEDVRRVLSAAAAMSLPDGREVVHVVPRSYRLDDSDGIRDPLGLAGRFLQGEAHLITGESLRIQNHLRVAAQAGLKVADYQVGIRAAGEAVLTREEREDGVLLLDIGASTTGIAVYDRGHLWHVGVLPVGGEHITSDIASLIRVPVSVAEQIKVERGWAAAELCPDESTFELASPSGQKVRAVEAKRVAQIIESRVHEILQLAASQVKRSGYTGLFPAGLVLTGGGAKLRGLVEVAADCLGLPTRIGLPNGELIAEPEFATAAGLVRWGARLVKDEAAAAAEAERQDAWERMKQWLRGFFG